MGRRRVSINAVLNEPSDHISSDNVSEDPPHEVKPTVMFQGWRDITFVHWRYQPEPIRRMLPHRLTLDTFDGDAWVGLTPFVVTGLRVPGLPALPWISRFPEMNVRTYVRGPAGERGVWFFSLEADRLAAVLGARMFYRLPYRWARMRVSCKQEEIEYGSRRHFRAGRADIKVQTGLPIDSNDQERFLTARYRLYTVLGGRLAFAQVHHPAWPLRAAKVLRLEQDVIEHSGLPTPTGEPLIHFSQGVSVRVGRPRLA